MAELSTVIYDPQNIHVACAFTMICAVRITIGDFIDVSIKSSIHSSSDDFSDKYLISPPSPKGFANVKNSPIHLKKYVMMWF